MGQIKNVGTMVMLLTILNVWMGGSGSAKAEERSLQYSQIPSLQGVIPQKTKFYTIDPTVGIDGMYYVFTVRSNHGEYTVLGITRLVKVTHEIAMIELFRASEHGNEAWNGAKDSLKGIGKGAKQIVLHPGDSGKAIGRSVKKIGRTVGRSVKSFFKEKIKGEEEETSSTGEDRAEGVGGFLTADHARVFAYQNDLDIYSTNPYVRALIGEVSKSRWKGSLGVSAALFFVSPIPGLSAVTDGALTGSARDEQVEILIRDNDPKELNRALEIQYREAFAVGRNSPAEVSWKSFLDNPNYSPREKAYTLTWLKGMGNLQGREALVQMLAGVSRVEDARFAFNQLELLSALHQFGKPLGGYAISGTQVGGILTTGDVVMLWPIDYADNTATLTGWLRALPRAAAGKSTNVWIIGDATPAFRTTAKSQSVFVQDKILKYKTFRQTRKTQPGASKPASQPAPQPSDGGNMYEP